MVEDECGRKAQPGTGVQPVPQVDGGEGVEAEVLEGAFGRDLGRSAVAQHRRHGLPYQVQRQRLLLGRPEGGEPAGQRRAGGGPAGGDPDQPVQHPRQFTVRRAVSQRGRVEAGGHHVGEPGGECGVEEGQALLERERLHATGRDAGSVGFGECVAHAVVGVPESPGE